ncbi:hypothetical protein Ciccas_012292, partial [Cichlidogyrus casuarinus]
VCATLGTTGICSFDHLDEICQVCSDYSNIWLHVDAAYAGSAFICPEYREKWFHSRQKIDSFVFNPSKWLMAGFDCTAFWVADATALHNTFNVNPLYLRHSMSSKAVDFMHWQIPLSRRFRALKLWFVLRYYGVRGLQNHIRKGVQLAEHFASLVQSDSRFELTAPQALGLVAFRLKGPDEINETLLNQINGQGLIHMVPAKFRDRYTLRFVITSPKTTFKNVEHDWKIIQGWAKILMSKIKALIPSQPSLKGAMSDIVEDREDAFYPSSPYHKRVLFKLTRFQSPFELHSLLMSNVTSKESMSKIVNGSFSATIDNEHAIDKFVVQLTRTVNLQKQQQSISNRLHLSNTTLDKQRLKADSFRSARLNSLDSKIDSIIKFVEEEIPDDSEPDN